MRILITSLVLALLGFVSATQAATYKWQDDNGHVVYSQQPPEDDRTYERVRGLPKPGQAASNQGVSQSANPTGGSATQDTAIPEDAIARQEKLRKENCEKAKKNLDMFTVYRRFKNEDGSITRMSDEERQKRIEESRAAINDFCK